jgi:hypothetical protein
VKIAPPARRSRINHSAQGFEISIPAKRNVLFLLFLPAWLVGWCFGEVFVTRELIFGNSDAPDLFLGAWLVLWTIGGATALYAWLWMVKGREVILLRADALVVRRELFGLGPMREYDLMHTRNLRFAQNTWNPYDWSTAMQFWGVGGGSIAFDYGSRTVRIGNSVDEAEAREIIKDLNARHPFPG